MKLSSAKLCIWMSIFFLLGCSKNQTYSQTLTDTMYRASVIELLEKGKKQKRNALILLGAGTTLFAASAALEKIASDEEERNTAAEGLLIGALCVIASVPEFISGAHKTHKAQVSLRIAKSKYPIERNYSFINVQMRMSL